VTGWATQKLSSACSRAEPWHFSYLPGNRDRRFRVNSVLLLAEDVIVDQVERVPADRT
jgi:hypothetical protein